MPTLHNIKNSSVEFRGAAWVETMVGPISSELHNIGRDHVGFLKVGRVRTRATREVAESMVEFQNMGIAIEILLLFCIHAELYILFPVFQPPS